ncbi:cyclic di-GMP phosphodiesterase Gmr [Paraburkholderia sp. GAS33]|uniref:diguanylate cyclase domain-containing protein n=1 Tax=Paraburkholderia sp. GAS33 TaxID=3035130 RepID=UPI003D1A51BF
MNYSERLQAFQQYFGSQSPKWTFAADSNALELLDVGGNVAVVIGLGTQEAEKIRALVEGSNGLQLTLKLIGKYTTVRLFGRRSSENTWTGLVSLVRTGVDSSVVPTPESFAERVVSEIRTLVVVVDREGRIRRFNQVAEECSGLTEESVIGKSAFDLFMDADDAAASRANISRFYQGGRTFAVERWVKTVSGPRLFLFRNRFMDGDGSPEEAFLICSGTDITEERAALNRLQAAANSDMLTGLRSRFHLTCFLDEELIKPETVGRLCLVYVDLNNFKRVNDTLGHEAGDQLIRKVAQRLESVATESNLVTRVGGDEFVLLTTGDTAANDAVQIASRILVEFEAPFAFRLSAYRLTVSVGIASHVDLAHGAHDLLSRADLAMYAAKDAGRLSGKSTYEVYTAEMSLRSERSVELYQSFQYGFLRNEFSISYRPIVGAGNALTGIAASAWWYRQGNVEVPPAELGELAKSLGFSVQLGEYTVSRACRWMSVHRCNDNAPLKLVLDASQEQLLDGDILGCISSMRRELDMGDTAVYVVASADSILRASPDVREQLRNVRKRGLMLLVAVGSESAWPNFADVQFDGIRLAADLASAVLEQPAVGAQAEGTIKACGELDLVVLVDGVDSAAQAAWFGRFENVELQGTLVSSSVSVCGIKEVSSG